MVSVPGSIRAVQKLFCALLHGGHSLGDFVGHVPGLLFEGLEDFFSRRWSCRDRILMALASISMEVGARVESGLAGADRLPIFIPVVRLGAEGPPAPGRGFCVGSLDRYRGGR